MFGITCAPRAAAVPRCTQQIPQIDVLCRSKTGRRQHVWRVQGFGGSGVAATTHRRGNRPMGTMKALAASALPPLVDSGRTIDAVGVRATQDQRQQQARAQHQRAARRQQRRLQPRQRGPHLRTPPAPVHTAGSPSANPTTHPAAPPGAAPAHVHCTVQRLHDCKPLHAHLCVQQLIRGDTEHCEYALRPSGHG